MNKSMLRNFAKRITAGLVTVLVVAGVSSSAIATFGPDRPTKAWSPTVSGFDYVTFNSFTGVGNGVGDERDFLRGVQVGRDSIWSDPVANVTQGAEVEAKIYIHNGADASLNTVPDGNGGFKGIAKDVKVNVTIPQGSGQNQQIGAAIGAANAQPRVVTDTLDLTGANNGFFELNYVPGSAKLHKGGNVTSLSDTLVTTGVNLGDINGCFEYVQEITFRVKVNMPRYTITKQTALPGETNWRESTSIKQGETVSWLITFKNTGATALNSVKVVDEVPAGLTVVPGTVKLTNGNYPNGYVYPASAIQMNGRQVNIDIGNYNPGILAYVTFRTTADSPTGPERCSNRTLVNKAFATPAGYGAIWDTAQTTVAGVECADAPVYSCDLLDITQGTNRTVTIKDYKFTARNGATFKDATIKWGDTATTLTNAPVGKTHTYAKDGTYTVSVTTNFTVNGQTVSVEGANCAKQVTLTTPGVVTPTTPTTLPKTGAGDVIGLFSAVSVAGGLAHRAYASRRFIR